MSDFFRPPEPPPEPARAPLQPAWLGPPENEIGVAVALRLLLARTEKVAVALTNAAAFSTGIEFSLETRLRERDELSDPFGMRGRQHVRGGGDLPDEVLRFGFEPSPVRNEDEPAHDRIVQSRRNPRRQADFGCHKLCYARREWSASRPRRSASPARARS